MGGHDTDNYVDNPPTLLLTLDRWVSKLLPAVLLLLFSYLGVYIFTDVSHIALDFAEGIVIGYFVVEIVLAAILYEQWVEFLKQKWVNILLIFPFLAAFRAVGQGAQVVRGIHAAEALRVASLAELPLVGQMVSRLPVLQKVGHAIIDAKLVIKQSSINRLGDLKRLFLSVVLIQQRRQQPNHSELDETTVDNSDSADEND